jgi:hypothetical protein
MKDPEAERSVLAGVLESKADWRPTRITWTPGFRWYQPAAILAAFRVKPATAGVLALFLVGFALGIFAYLTSSSDDVSKNTVATRPTIVIESPTPEPSGTPDNTGRNKVPETRKPVRVKPRPKQLKRPSAEDAPVPDALAKATRPKMGDPRRMQPDAAIVVPASPPAATSPTYTVARAMALDTARHAEQAQMFLRSFRNTGLKDADIAYERARSKKLLYRNIVLRRKASANRDLRTAQAFDRLEPILIDIANLPENAAAGDIESIRERMKKKNILVLLQASTTRR